MVVCTCMCVHIWEWRPKVDVCYLPHSPFTCFEKESLVSHELIGFDRLPGQYVPVLKLPAHAFVPAFYTGARDLNTGPHAGTAAILLTESCSNHCAMFLIFLNNAYILLAGCSLFMMLGVNPRPLSPF